MAAFRAAFAARGPRLNHPTNSFPSSCERSSGLAERGSVLVRQDRFQVGAIAFPAVGERAQLGLDRLLALALGAAKLAGEIFDERNVALICRGAREAVKLARSGADEG